jgi:hypothetical protein
VNAWISYRYDPPAKITSFSQACGNLSRDNILRDMPWAVAGHDQRQHTWAPASCVPMQGNQHEAIWWVHLDATTANLARGCRAALPTPILLGLALHRWRGRVLALEPVGGAARPIARAQPLRHDAFEAILQAAGTRRRRGA